MEHPYSQGPWEARKRADGGFDICMAGARPSSGCIARVPGVETKPVMANAVLIAAAPLLVDALQICVDAMHRSDAELHGEAEPISAEDWFAAMDAARGLLSVINPIATPSPEIGAGSET